MGRSVHGSSAGWTNLRLRKPKAGKTKRGKKRPPSLDRPLRDSRAWEQQYAAPQTAPAVPPGPATPPPDGLRFVYECQRCLRRVAYADQKKIVGRRAVQCQHCDGRLTWVQIGK